MIHETSRCSGCIRIDARVHVTISEDEGNSLLEQGEDRRTFGNAWWEFETRSDGTIRVAVWDLAGNVALQEA